MIKVNNKQLEVTHFPDGTSQVWKLPTEMLTRMVYIDWEFTHEGELMHLVQLVDLLRASAAQHITLNMDYLPYARQDKVLSNESTFALESFAKVINSLDLDEVTAVDVHSGAAFFLINNFRNIIPYTYVQAAFDAVNPDVICFPDKGALSRYGKDLSFLEKPYSWAEKERDQLTGLINSVTLLGCDVHDQNVLIVDDICDGGMTFVLLTKSLLTKGARSVNLYTSHGLYSKGLRPLKDAKIERIFNKNGEVGELQGQIVIHEFNN